MAKRLKKKDLKAPDEFSVYLRKLLDFFLENQTVIISSLAAVIIAVSSVSVYRYFKRKNLERANAYFYKVYFSNDTSILENYVRRLNSSFLGEGIKAKLVKVYLKEKNDKKAEKIISSMDPPFFSKLPFAFEIPQKFVRATFIRSRDPEKFLRILEDMGKGDNVFLKNLSLLRMALLLEDKDREEAIDIYKNLSEKNEFDPLLRGFSERRYLFLKNKKKE